MGEMMVQMNDESCHGVYECLEAGSKRWALSPLLKPWQKVYSYAAWHVENLGWSNGLKDLCLGVRHGRNAMVKRSDPTATPAVQEALGLLPGEWVEVKPIEEILATLIGNLAAFIVFVVLMRKFFEMEWWQTVVVVIASRILGAVAMVPILKLFGE